MEMKLTRKWFVYIVFLMILVSLTGFCFASGKKEETTSTTIETTNTLETVTSTENDFDPTQTPPDGFFKGDRNPPDGNFERGGAGGPGGFGGAGFSSEPPVNTAKENTSSRNIIDNKEDEISNISFTSGVLINLSTGKTTYSGNATSSNVEISQNSFGYSITSSLKEALKITLTGKLSGTFTVDSTASDYEILLDNAEIIATDGPALNLLSKTRVFIASTAGSKNILTDSAERKENTKKGALYSKGAIVFTLDVDKSGKTGGTITVNGGYKNGVYSDDYIKIDDGILNVNISARDAIRTINGFIMNDGKLTINGTGSGIDEESKGIKVDGEENTKKAGEGFIVINGGTINSTTVGKAITAAWETEEDAETEDTSDDPNPYLTINGGTINIVTTATPYEKTQSDGTTVSCSPEGIEAKSDLTINGGTIKIRTADDCINAGISITINGGSIDCISSANDAIDSNGTLTFNGGTINATGGQGAECAFDSDMYAFTINGGTAIGTGGSNITNPSTESKQNVIVYNANLSNGDTVTIKNSSKKTVITFKTQAGSNTLIISSPDLVQGETYTLTTSSGLSESFTINSAVTSVGTASGDRGFGGHQMGQMGGREMGGRMPDRMLDDMPDDISGGVQKGPRGQRPNVQ